MKTIWINGLDAEKKTEMKKEFNSSSLLRERLSALITDKKRSNRKKNILESAYDNPNWAYLQADSVGYERVLEEVISLIS
mgnify:CR=1 FL=1